eukprot:jgi/Mesen1/9829/ME000007S09884
MSVDDLPGNTCELMEDPNFLDLSSKLHELGGDLCARCLTSIGVSLKKVAYDHKRCRAVICKADFIPQGKVSRNDRKSFGSQLREKLQLLARESVGKGPEPQSAAGTTDGDKLETFLSERASLSETASGFNDTHLYQIQKRKGPECAAIETVEQQTVKSPDGGLRPFTQIRCSSGTGQLEALEKRCEEAQEMAWEALHTGPWRSVDVAWRDAYALSGLILADVQRARGELEKAMRALDIAALMGGPLYRPRIDKAMTAVANLLSEQRQTLQSCTSPPDQEDLTRGEGTPSQGSAAEVNASAASRNGNGIAQGCFVDCKQGACSQETEQHLAPMRGRMSGPRVVRRKVMGVSEGAMGRPQDEGSCGLAEPTATRPGAGEALARRAMEGAGPEMGAGAAAPAGSFRKLPPPGDDARTGASGLRSQEGQVEGGEVASMAQAVPGLPPGSFHGGLVKRKELPSLEDFLCDHMLPGVPVIITGGMSLWPAMDRWQSLKYLKRVAGARTVPVEVGEHYLADSWRQDLMTISSFIDHHLAPSSFPRKCQVANEAQHRAYLAQHPLFEQIPKLREDIGVPEYCALGGGALETVNAWLGPAGTITPLHHDPHHNLLAQVVGRKYVRLYAASETAGMYPHEETMLQNSSQVDLDNVDHARFPLTKELTYVDCLLRPGDMLYIPPKWWHYVRSLSVSFSVSFWWSVPP